MRIYFRNYFIMGRRMRSGSRMFQIVHLMLAPAFGALRAKEL
jgi:hypothetical protein